MLYIYTESFNRFFRIKNGIKTLLGLRQRGPKAVEQNLLFGLKEFGADYRFNQKLTSEIEYACVLSGPKVLAWAVKQKKQGKIKKIIAGPNIVVSPKDEGGILTASEVDKVLVPSQWVHDFYLKLSPELLDKIRIWPVGVDAPEVSIARASKSYDFLVYNKIGQNKLVLKILNFLSNNGYNFKVLKYGKFKQTEYFSLLEQSRYEIYLSVSESQGLAMFESWARGVPTLVWESGNFGKFGVKVTGKISAPYLDEQVGLGFCDFEDFKNKVNILTNSVFSPRDYVKKNFSSLLCARNYLAVCYDQKNLQKTF